MKAGTTNQA